MDWIFLSPHLDDVALSCGGLVWDLTQNGEAVAVWTICAGDPPTDPLSPFATSLHTRWNAGLEATQRRRAEDIASCRRMAAAPRHFPIPDCIYRRHPHTHEPLYTSEEAIFGELHPAEVELVDTLTRQLRAWLPKTVNLVCPLTLGNHVDHRLTRQAAERLNHPLWYYADYPYVLHDWQENDERATGLPCVTFPTSEAGLTAWVESIAAHASQASTFWPDRERMQAAIRDYCLRFGGVRLWRDPKVGLHSRDNCAKITPRR